MLTVTLISLVVAAASGFIAWRSVRREHLRSDARVAWLASSIDSSSADDEPGPGDAFTWFDREAEPGVATAIVEEPAHSSTRRPLLTAAAGLAVVLAIVVLIAMSGNRSDPKPAAPTLMESLELLSLGASRDGTTLAVTGVVRNRADEPLDAVSAIVSAVDAHGRPVGSGRSLLTALSPGDESRFVVTISRVSGVARYRVSFRGATGLIRHVDRRADRPSDQS
jgi:hypothetical protein